MSWIVCSFWEGDSPRLLDSSVFLQTVLCYIKTFWRREQGWSNEDSSRTGSWLRIWGKELHLAGNHPSPPRPFSSITTTPHIPIPSPTSELLGIPQDHSSTLRMYEERFMSPQLCKQAWTEFKFPPVSFPIFRGLLLRVLKHIECCLLLLYCSLLSWFHKVGHTQNPLWEILNYSVFGDNSLITTDCLVTAPYLGFFCKPHSP